MSLSHNPLCEKKIFLYFLSLKQDIIIMSHNFRRPSNTKGSHTQLILMPLAAESKHFSLPELYWWPEGLFQL